MTSAFYCQRCGNCCRHRGEVRVSVEEVAALAGFLDLPMTAFTERYTRLREDRLGLALTDRPDGACVFLEDAPVTCRVQLVKPRQCRDFPFAWRYENLERVCPASRESASFHTAGDLP